MMMRSAIALALIGAVVVGSHLRPAEAVEGVDISQLYSSSDYSCLVSSGRIFAIPRVYQSTGNPDPNGPANVDNAWAGGMSYVDGYIFPCYYCSSSGQQQVADAVNYLAANGVYTLRKGETRGNHTNDLENASGATVGQFWLDIEDSGNKYWSTSASSNNAFISELIDGCNQMGVVCGIYASSSMWSSITGDTTQFSYMPLWDAHWNYQNTLSDFVPYGGWTSCNMKQYQGDTSVCGMGVDLNCY